MAKSPLHRPILPSRGTMDRVTRVTHQVERAPSNAQPARAKPPVGAGSGGERPVQVGDSGIAAGDMSAPAEGPAKFVRPIDGAPGLETYGDDFDILNVYTTTVSPGALVWVRKIGRRWYIVAGNCGPSA